MTKLEFPSPTGVNYYESFVAAIFGMVHKIGFRPQQGLTITNKRKGVAVVGSVTYSFRPQQGLTITNLRKV